jgi:hypothetical protein
MTSIPQNTTLIHSHIGKYGQSETISHPVFGLVQHSHHDIVGESWGLVTQDGIGAHWWASRSDELRLTFVDIPLSQDTIKLLNDFLIYIGVHGHIDPESLTFGQASFEVCVRIQSEAVRQ